MTLFLLNPSGIMFGPNATLEINGSFHASTAEMLRFADGQDFMVRVSPEASLSVSPPSAFGFINAHAPISIRESTLEVTEGETLSIGGGDMTIIGGTLEAPSGRINLASVASAGDVAFAGGNLNTDSLSTLGSITMTEESQLDASGALGRVGGQIVIRGRQLTMTNADILVTNRSDQTGGGVDVVVDGAITLVDTAILSDTFATGQGGHIVLQADTVTIEGERIRTNTIGGGQGGDIRVEATTVMLTGGRSPAVTTEAMAGQQAIFSFMGEISRLRGRSRCAIVC